MESKALEKPSDNRDIGVGLEEFGRLVWWSMKIMAAALEPEDG